MRNIERGDGNGFTFAGGWVPAVEGGLAEGVVVLAQDLVASVTAGNRVVLVACVASELIMERLSRARCRGGRNAHLEVMPVCVGSGADPPGAVVVVGSVGVPGTPTQTKKSSQMLQADAS